MSDQSMTQRLAELSDEDRAKVEHLARCGAVSGWLRHLICRRGHRLDETR